MDLWSPSARTSSSTSRASRRRQGLPGELDGDARQRRGPGPRKSVNPDAVGQPAGRVPVWSSGRGRQERGAELLPRAADLTTRWPSAQLEVREDQRHLADQRPDLGPEIDHEEALQVNPPVQVKAGTAEVWNLESTSGGWDHPVHITSRRDRDQNNGGNIGGRRATAATCTRWRATSWRCTCASATSPTASSSTRHQERRRPLRHALPQPLHEEHSMMATFTVVP